MSINRGMDKENVVHIYVEYCSAIKNNEIMPSAVTWVELETIILNEVSHTVKKEHCMASFIYGIQKEMIQMNLRNRNRLTVLENRTYSCWWGRIAEEWGGGGRGKG